MFRPYCPRMNWLIWHITMVFPFAAAGSADSSMAIVKLPVASPTSIAIDAVIVWQLVEPAVHHGLPVWSGQTLLHSRLSGSDKKAQPPAVSMNAIAGFEPGRSLLSSPADLQCKRRRQRRLWSRPSRQSLSAPQALEPRWLDIPTARSRPLEPCSQLQS